MRTGTCAIQQSISKATSPDLLQFKILTYCVFQVVFTDEQISNIIYSESSEGEEEYYEEESVSARASSEVLDSSQNESAVRMLPWLPLKLIVPYYTDAN